MALDAHLTETAARLFIEHGYEGVSMEQVAAAAGAGKQSLYRRYSGKEALFREVFTNNLIREVMARHAEQVALFAASRSLPNKDPLEQLHRIARSLFDFILERKTVEVFRLFVGERNRFPELRTEIRQMVDVVEEEIMQQIRIARSSGLIRKAPDQHAARSFMALICEGPLARALLELPSLEAQAGRDEYFDGAWKAFKDTVGAAR
jgi:AcrR family transcriptional regulator